TTDIACANQRNLLSCHDLDLSFAVSADEKPQSNCDFRLGETLFWGWRVVVVFCSAVFRANRTTGPGEVAQPGAESNRPRITRSPEFGSCVFPGSTMDDLGDHPRAACKLAYQGRHHMVGDMAVRAHLRWGERRLGWDCMGAALRAYRRGKAVHELNA